MISEHGEGSHVHFSERCSWQTKGWIDGIWTNATIGISWLLDLTYGQAKDITFLTLDVATVEALCQQYGFTPTLCLPVVILGKMNRW